MANPFVWVELHTKEAEKAKRFYGELVGWQTQDIGEGARKYAMIMGDENGVGGITTEPTKNNPNPHWLPYIGVADLAAATAKARKLGASVHEENVPVPGMGRFTIITDPTGAEVALWQNDAE